MRRWRCALPWLMLLPSGLLAGWIRYGMIESSAAGALCTSGLGPPWCALRQALVWGFQSNLYGMLALLAALLALLPQRPRAAWLAAALGLFALELYCVQAGSLALLIGCLRLLRWQVLPATDDQHRRGDQQVQTQP